jgi:hypothetical protein
MEPLRHVVRPPPREYWTVVRTACRDDVGSKPFLGTSLFTAAERVRDPENQMEVALPFVGEVRP